MELSRRPGEGAVARRFNCSAPSTPTKRLRSSLRPSFSAAASGAAGGGGNSEEDSLAAEALVSLCTNSEGRAAVYVERRLVSAPGCAAAAGYLDTDNAAVACPQVLQCTKVTMSQTGILIRVMNSETCSLNA